MFCGRSRFDNFSKVVKSGTIKPKIVNFESFQKPLMRLFFVENYLRPATPQKRFG